MPTWAALNCSEGGSPENLANARDRRQFARHSWFHQGSSTMKSVAASLKSAVPSWLRIILVYATITLAGAAHALDPDKALVGKNIPSGYETVSMHALQGAGIDWLGPESKLPVSCPYQGEGWTLSFSKDLYASYKGRGFSLRAICLALASGDIHYDPSTGQRIRGYILKEEERGAEEVHPFRVPDCFREVEVIEGDGTAEVLWRPRGCDVKFDPRSGRRVSSPKKVRLLTGGGAGGARDEDNRSSTISTDRARALISGK